MLLRFETRAPQSQMSHFYFWKIGEEWEPNSSKYLVKLSTLPIRVLDFRCIAPFRNQSASKATAVENRGQISHFWPP